MLPTLRSNNLLSDFFSDFLKEPIWKTETHFDTSFRRNDDGSSELEIEVPGFNKDNLNVELSDNLLTIKGDSDNRKVFRQYTVNQNVKDIQASIKDGLLKIKFVENIPEKEVKKIEISE